MAVAASLNVLLTANAAQFNATFESATKTLTALNSSIGGLKKSIDGIGANFGNAAGNVGKFGASLASIEGILKGGVALFAGKQIFDAAIKATKAVLDVASVIDEQKQLADRIGTTLGALQGLRRAALENGVATEVVNSSLSKMVLTLGDAESGSAAAAAALNQISLSASILKNLAPEQQFGLILDRIRLLPTYAERAAAIRDIFGKSASELGNLLQLTASDYQQYVEQATGSAAAMTDEQVASLERTKNAVDRLHEAWTSLKATFATAFAPTLARELQGIAVAMEHLATGRSRQSQSRPDDTYEPARPGVWRNTRTGHEIGDAEAHQMYLENRRRMGFDNAGGGGRGTMFGFTAVENRMREMFATITSGVNVAKSTAMSAATAGSVSAMIGEYMRSGGIAWRGFTKLASNEAQAELSRRANMPTAAAGISAGSQADRLFSLNRTLAEANANPIKQLTQVQESALSALQSIARALKNSIPVIDL